jgi:hypothetical protein
MAYLYRHIRLDKNEPFYIGIATDKKYKREMQKSARRNNIWNNIALKTKYDVEILIDDLTLEEANQKEKEFILMYGRIDLGTGTLANLTDGGEGQSGFIVSDKTKNKISKSKKGRKYNDEYKKKLSLSHIGIKHSEETKKKMSEKRKGKPFSNEHRGKINEKVNKKVALIQKNGNIIKSYKSISEASLDNNVSASALCHVVSGRRMSTNNKYFKYI